MSNCHRQQKRTKIVATLGPASDQEAVLRQMILGGLDVVRLNFSHGTAEYLRPLISLVRALSDELEIPIAIMGDLRGPRIRVGDIENNSVDLETGQQFVLTPETVPGDQRQVSVSYPRLGQDVQVGSLLLLDDGNIKIQVEKIETNGAVVGRVTQGGMLSSHRGINLPGLRVSLPSITQKDFADIDFAIEQNLDFLALSFVQSAEDVRQLKTYLAQKDSPIEVIAKVERRNALDDIKAIARTADGVMVARGDLALEMSIEDIPIAQKKIITVCRQLATPVITATQMLESMIEHSKPTRAEATDVANAILDGTDALMLSGETAIGHYPVETVTTMASIAANIERAWLGHELPGPVALDPPPEIEATVGYASQVVAKTLSARAIIIYTRTGQTAHLVACHRPFIPILALSDTPITRRRLALTWGVDSALTEEVYDTDRMIEVALFKAQECEAAGPGDTVVITAGTPPQQHRSLTNTLKVEQIPAKPVVEPGHD